MRKQKYSSWDNCMDQSSCPLYKVYLPEFAIQLLNNLHAHFLATFFFGECSSTTVVVLGAIFGITNTFRPFSDDIFRYSKNLMFFHVLAYTYVSHLFLSQY